MAQIKITYSSIIAQCRRFSAYEGSTSAGSSGESLYRAVRLTDRDDELLKGYIHQAISMIVSSLSSSLDVGSELGEDKATLAISNGLDQAGASSSTSALTKSLSETVQSYVMHLWLSDKLPERSKAYRQIFADMLENARRIAFKRKRPSMEE